MHTTGTGLAQLCLLVVRFSYEASSWEYSFYMPHDVQSIVQKSGGNEAFLQRLDLLFDREYYNVGNEPSFLTPTLYHWVGRPDLSSQRIHQIIDRNYDDSHAGIPGNDDSGAMSSWLAFPQCRPAILPDQHFGTGRFQAASLIAACPHSD